MADKKERYIANRVEELRYRLRKKGLDIVNDEHEEQVHKVAAQVSQDGRYGGRFISASDLVLEAIVTTNN